jgi:chromate transporter
LTNLTSWVLAVFAFAGIMFLHLPFPLIVIAGALAGFLVEKFRPNQSPVIGSPSENREFEEADNMPHTKPTWRRTLRVAAVCLTLWWLPVLAAGFLLGWNDTVFRQGVFFSKAAMVTFGGAYAVLPYVSQQAVGHYGWLTAGQMMDGLGLAETTPGPLIMVLQFVGFLGAWHQPGSLPLLVSATLGAAITTWTTFLPSFLWIFLGAPHIEQLRGNKTLSSALAAITATVVGVMVSLAFWFGAHVLSPQTIDWFAVTVSAIALFGLLRLGWPVIPVIVAAALAGVLWMTV